VKYGNNRGESGGSGRTPDAAPDTPGGLPDAAGRLGVEPVGRLLLKFSIPAVAGMVLSALYNVVDRIFVGNGVDEFALGGLSLILPLQTFVMAFAMLFGIGAANLISIRLGESRRKEAETVLNCCFYLLAGISLVITAAGFIFIDEILGSLGAQEGSKAIEYAAVYYKIILIGLPVFITGFGMTHCTRAQGFPGISMAGMVIGAGTNMILDPVFIFALHLGVEGAAYATIISQFLSTAWILYFNFTGKAVIRLHLIDFWKERKDRKEECAVSANPLHPSAISIPASANSLPAVNSLPAITRTIMAFGAAQFFLQFAMSGVQLLLNNSMGWYGAASLGVANGGDIAITGMNIIGTFNMFILMPVFGINQGAQPVLGFNWGAKKFNRVRRAYLLAVFAATVICTAGFLVTELLPGHVVRLFARGASKELADWAVWSMRVACIVLPLVGFQIVSANMFVVTGRPKASIFLSMTRQIIVLIPAILILGRLFGVKGVVTALPIADGAAVAITSVMIFFELRPRAA